MLARCLPTPAPRLRRRLLVLEPQVEVAEQPALNLANWAAVVVAVTKSVMVVLLIVRS